MSIATPHSLKARALNAAPFSPSAQALLDSIYEARECFDDICDMLRTSSSFLPLSSGGGR